MKPQAFLFMSRSGAGKGTQADLLIQYLKKTTGLDSYHLSTGAEMREFIKESNHTAKLTEEIMDQGGLMPPFLAIYIWSKLLIKNLTDNIHLVLDGVGRIKIEAEVLNTALKFYDRPNPIIIYLNVSNDWARARLHERARSDDLKPEDVERRLAWFEDEVQAAIAFYRADPGCRFIEINGEQSIEKVHQDIVAALEKDAD